MTKEEDIKFIKGFTKITIKSICKDLNIDEYNVCKGTASAKNIRKVKEEIQKRYKDIKG